MNRNLHEKVGSMEYEKLFAGMEPSPIVKHGTIRKMSAETVLKRGTLMAKSDTDHKLVVFGTAGENNASADCVLADDITVGTISDENVAVYVTGHFNASALILAEGASISEAAIDDLRKKGILLGTVQEP